MKKKSLTQELDGPLDLLDIILIIEKREIIRFSLNYRAYIKGAWHQIYRVDNHHGYLHEQRFWRSPKPIRINHENIPLGLIIKKYASIIRNNYKRYKSLYEDKNDIS